MLGNGTVIRIRDPTEAERIFTATPA